MEQAQQEKVYMERLPLVAMQIRSALGNIYYGMQKLAPADERDEDPILDANAAMLYHGYFRLLRLAKNLESASMLNRKELLPTENTDLKVWLDEIIREAEVPFELKGVQLEMVCEERYAITAVNEPWLSQALWQLLSNALKACSAGGKVTVTLAVQKPHVLIKVKDTGCGIPADRQEMLFRWHMRPMTLDYVAGGVGLGLPLAHQIARLHGGQLLLNSREGQGTTATIALPMVRALGTLGENIEDYTGGFQRVLLELADALNEVLSGKWRNLRGLEIVSFGVSSVKASEEDEQMLKEMQRNAAFMDPTRAAAHLVGAQAAAMQSAASNQGAGPAMAFMGMNMAGQMGGMNAQGLYQMGAQQQAQQPAPAAPAAPANGWTCSCGQSGITGNFCPNCGSKKPEPKPAAGSWKCPQCGATATGKFCPECGTKKPEVQADGWTCSCGAVNKGKFCAECGKPKPAGVPQYKCDKCGWEPADPAHPPKFCPECGDPFDDGDLK